MTSDEISNLKIGRLETSGTESSLIGQWGEFESIVSLSDEVSTSRSECV